MSKDLLEIIGVLKRVLENSSARRAWPTETPKKFRTKNGSEFIVTHFRNGRAISSVSAHIPSHPFVARVDFNGRAVLDSIVGRSVEFELRGVQASASKRGLPDARKWSAMLQRAGYSLNESGPALFRYLVATDTPARGSALSTGLRTYEILRGRKNVGIIFTQTRRSKPEVVETLLLHENHASRIVSTLFGRETRRSSPERGVSRLRSNV